MSKIPLGSIEPVTFKVKNIGGAGVPAGKIIKCHIEGKPDVEIRGPLGVNEEKTASFVVSDAPAGRQTKRATISPDRQIGNQNNNTALIPFEVIVPAPDLVVTNVHPLFPQMQVGQIKIIYTIKNQGNLAVEGNILCRFRSTNPNLTWYATVPNRRLEPGQEIKNIEFIRNMYRDDNITRFITQYTTVSMNLEIDPSNNIPEGENENNNSRSFSFDYFLPEHE